MNLLLILSMCFVFDQSSLLRLLENDGIVGMVPLREGYVGTLKGDKGDDESALNNFEFTHLFVGRGDDETTIRKALVVGQNNLKQSFRAMTYHIKELPSIDAIKKIDSISGFEKLFGKTLEPRSGVGFDGIMRSTMSWMAFRVNSDGTVFVVSVLVRTVDNGDGERIDSTEIKSGVFRSTGSPPKLEE